MRLHILGDLHVESAPIRLPATNAEAIILAGDIHTGYQGLEWIRSCFGGKEVIYVLGNHEFYGTSAPELAEALKRETAGSNIHVLENGAVEINGFTFLGCTLWSDFMLAGDAKCGMEAAEDAMSDYYAIRYDKQGRRLAARDTAQFHKDSVAWLKGALARCDRARTIIVTHHAPSRRSIAPCHSGSDLSAAFASNLDELVRQSRVPLWVYGHTHYNADYTLGSTRVVGNQRGYPEEPCQRFDPGLLVEV